MLLLMLLLLLVAVVVDLRCCFRRLLRLRRLVAGVAFVVGVVFVVAVALAGVVAVLVLSHYFIASSRSTMLGMSAQMQKQTQTCELHISDFNHDLRTDILIGNLNSTLNFKIRNRLLF